MVGVVPSMVGVEPSMVGVVPRATELACGRFGVPLPSPHAPLYLEKDRSPCAHGVHGIPKVEGIATGETPERHPVTPN